MNRKDLYTALGEMDDDILERSEHKGKKTSKSIWFRWGAIAACFFLFVSKDFGTDFKGALERKA